MYEGLDFERKRGSLRELPLIPLIDVIFVLIVFFMLTSSFMKMESLELMLPAAGPAKKSAAVKMSQIYLENSGRIIYGQRPVDKVELKNTLDNIFLHFPDQRAVVMVSPDVSLQALVDVMDIVYVAGGKNVYVREWKQ